MLSLSVVSKFNKHFFFTEKSIFLIKSDAFLNRLTVFLDLLSEIWLHYVTSLFIGWYPCFTWLLDSGDNGMVGKKWAASWQNQKMACAPREDSDQPGHPPVFPVRMKKTWALRYQLSAQRRLWSDWRLIWVFAWHTVILLVLSWGGSNVNKYTRMPIDVTVLKLVIQGDEYSVLKLQIYNTLLLC